MLDFNKPMTLRGSKLPARYIGEIKRKGFTGGFNHAFVVTEADGSEDIHWRKEDGTHAEGFQQFDIINAPERREVYVNLKRRHVLGENNGDVPNTIETYGRPIAMPHDDFDTITLTYLEDKLVDVSFIMQG